MYPHRIRLRGPWECEPIERWIRVHDGTTKTSKESLPPKRTMTLPCRWMEGGLGDFAGKVRYLRRFGRPGRIDAHERVWLTFGGADAIAEVWLNGQFLGCKVGICDAFEFDVTTLLQSRNNLVVEVEGDEGGGLNGEVALEIRCTAYLRDTQVRGTIEGDKALLQVTGEVVGTCEGPLELYVLLDRLNLIYSPVETKADGRPFHLISDPLSWGIEESSQKHDVRVELVNVATVWYEWEQSIQFQSEVL
jgi:hypothetical protein